MKNNRGVGSWGEDIAARFLVQKGYAIICRNFHARVGEIDIIAWHEEKLFGKTLCFIEVKTPTDRLRPTQFEWFKWALKNEINCELCNIKTNKLRNGQRTLI